MKWMTMSLAGVLAATSLVPAAEAQRWRDDDRGWHDNGRHRGYDRDDRRRWDREHRGRDDRRWRGDGRRYGWNGYGRDRGWDRGRTVCRWQDGYYGPVKRCFRVRG
ncbi:hypothetical protein K7957_02560 [Sphingomonas yunnanensis]|uniref:hypothetical protein n=1 Tax=Sphingomonas yunnanensis TaxID=310400 RepID=UPI001CA6353F|nr:hypothetical protein [Sphingomonas yunnanensis]MBY9061813.1 hypothetical protein [Sphingomonas yunnanensis]